MNSALPMVSLRYRKLPSTGEKSGGVRKLPAPTVAFTDVPIVPPLSNARMTACSSLSSEMRWGVSSSLYCTTSRGWRSTEELSSPTTVVSMSERPLMCTWPSVRSTMSCPPVLVLVLVSSATHKPASDDDVSDPRSPLTVIDPKIDPKPRWSTAPLKTELPNSRPWMLIEPTFWVPSAKMPWSGLMNEPWGASPNGS